MENLVSEYQKRLWYRALWEEFMGEHGVILYRIFQ
jgi:hypothetical protein